MKLRLLILLAAALAASPAAGQTIKSLGYNTTNGQVVYSGTNTLRMPDQVKFGTNSAGVSSGGQFLTLLDGGGGVALQLGTNRIIAYDAIDFGGVSGTALSNAATTRTNLGLGETNTVTFSNIQLGLFGTASATGFAGRSSGGQFVLYGTNVSSSVPAFYGWDGFNNAAMSAGTSRTNLGLGATWLTNTDVTNFRTAIGLGATNNVTFSNVSASGTLGVTGNVTLSGTANTAPSQTASSGASLMTRDLVDARLGNPESTFNTTYWFGLEGLGNWITAGTGVTTAPTAGGGAGLNTTLTFWTTARIGTNHAGVAIQSPSDNIAGGNMWRPSDGNNVTFRLRIRKGGVTSQPAFAFMLGNRLQSSIWAVGAYGLFYVAQPTNSWVSNAVVTQHSRIAVSNVVWAVNTAGTNGATEPTWTDLIGSLVTNGSAVYINAGPHTSNNWVLALGHTNASQVVMTNTGKTQWPTNNRAELTLKLRGVQSSSPYTIFASVQDGTGESAEVSLSHSNNNPLGPQMWHRWDGPGAVADGETVSIRYIGIQGTLPPLF